MTISTFLVPLLVILSVTIVSCLVLAGFLRWLYEKAMIWTRVGFSLVIGLFCTQNLDPIVENDLLNFAIFAAIALGVILVISFVLDRTDVALKFASTAFFASLVNNMVALIAYYIIGIILGFVDQSGVSSPPWLVTVATIVSLLYALHEGYKELVSQVEFLVQEENGIKIMVDRVAASLVYGFCIGFFILLALASFFSMPSEAAGILWLVFCGVPAAAAFAADWFWLTPLVDEAREELKESGQL